MTGGLTGEFGRGVPDAIFAHPRLASLYDAFDGPHDDLAAYAGRNELESSLAAGQQVWVGC
jgi:hypothetical protein